MKMFKFLCIGVYGLFFLSLLSCEESQSLDTISLENYKNVEIIDSTDVVQPLYIEYLEQDRIAIIDGYDLSIKVFDSEGNFLVKISRSGKGPGEVMSPFFLQELGNKIIIADNSLKRLSFFSYDGKLIESFNYNSELYFGNVIFLGDSLYVTEKGVNDINRFQILDISGNHILDFGSNYQSEENKGFYKSSNPELVKNISLLRKDGDYVYGYSVFYNELSKFDFKESTMVWKKQVKIPYVKDVEELLVWMSKKAPEGMHPHLNLLTDYKVVNGVIYILTIKLTNKPQLLIKITDEGNDYTMYNFKQSDPFYSSLAVSDKKNEVYVTSFLSESVKKIIF